MNAWIPLVFLPIPPKGLGGVVGYTVEQQELGTLQVIHEIISRILSPLSDAASLRGIEMVCCDEKVRRCVPRLTGGLADHMGNATLHCVATTAAELHISTPQSLPARGSIDCFKLFLELLETWYLVDSPTPPLLKRSMMVVAVSPKNLYSDADKRYHEFFKRSPKVILHGALGIR